MKFWGRHRILFEAAFASVAFAAAHRAGAESILRTSDGAALYTAVVTGSAAIAAIGLIPMSIIVGLSSLRVQRLIRQKGDSVRRSLAAGVFLHLVTALAAIFVMAFDSAKHPLVNARCIVVALFVVAIEATCRVVVEFLAVLRLNDAGRQAIGELPRL